MVFGLLRRAVEGVDGTRVEWLNEEHERYLPWDIQLMPSPDSTADLSDGSACTYIEAKACLKP